MEMKMVRIFKNKTASDVTITFGNTGLVVPANGESDLALVFQSWQLANIDTLVLLLAQGVDSFQINDGTSDLESVAAIDLVRGYSQNVNIKTASITLPSQSKGFRDLTGHNYWKKGFRFSNVAGQTTNSLEKFSSGFYLCGGGYKTDGNAADGDYVEFSIVDVDNVLGYGYNVTLGGFVTTDYVWANKEWQVLMEDGKFIPAGIYLKFKYVSVGGTDVKACVWYDLRT
jgi:hypothetical protein